MNNRNKMKSIAEETVSILKYGTYRTRKGSVNIKEIQKKCEKNTFLYTPKDTDNFFNESILIKNENCIIEITTESTLAACKRLLEEGYKNVSCLNFASAKRPGGGFLTGSISQEETLARNTGLYFSLNTKKEFYNFHKENRNPLYSDYMIYSSDVPVIRDDNYDLLENPYTVSIITSPSVNKGAITNKEDLKKVHEIMKKRIEKIILLAIKHNNDTLVLGAYGCGVFKNRPEDVANYFKEVLEQKSYKKAFKKVVFAIYGGPSKNLEAFEKVFKK